HNEIPQYPFITEAKETFWEITQTLTLVNCTQVKLAINLVNSENRNIVEY
ncbi:11562_t:CDS:1, partial [Ambispora leptoticha]